MRNISELMSVLLRRLIEALEFVCTCVYSVFLPIIHSKPRRIVIYYHSIKRQDVKRFEKQMRCLAGNFHVVKTSQINTAVANGSDVLIAITFDDAFVSVAEEALPILKKYGLQASVFVPTGSLGSHPKWAIDQLWYPHKDEKLMSEKQIVELSNDCMEVFSHTVSHAKLTDVDNDRLMVELTESKQALEKLTGKEVLAVSYPLGAYNKKVCEAARQAGYKLGFTTDSCMVRSSADNFKIGRFPVSAADGLIKFRLKVIGAYQVSKYLRALKRVLKFK